MTAPETAPRFSVVVPAYNSARTIEATLRSILAQSRGELELIVVDDGSSDSTAEIVGAIAAADPRVLLTRQANAGTAGARNTGIGLARGSLVSFLDHDDLWLPGYLEAMDTALASAPEAGFAFTDAWLFDEGAGRVRKRTALEHYPPVADLIAAGELLELLVGGPNFIMSSATVRREVLAEVHGFNAEIRGVDDWDLWLRIAAAGHGAVRAAGCELVQRDHAASQSKDLAMMYEGIEEVLGRVIERYDVPEEIRDLARAKLAEVDDELAGIRGDRPLARAAYRFREVAVHARKRVRSEWRDEPPEAIRRHLPGLVR